MLNAGFARVDITPVFGTTLEGYPFIRRNDGVLDPLLATAVAFNDGEKTAIVMSVDLIGISQPLMNRIRTEIATACGTEPEGVFVACTHTHLGPEMCFDEDRKTYQNAEYIEFFIKRVCNAACMAVEDMAPSEMSYTRARVEDVSFVRTYEMRDGSLKTNPGYQNPDIVKAVSEPDEEATLLILKREGKQEIGIVNFQVHPDVIGGNKVSADYPKFVRDTYEALVPNALCMYITGTQGDTNHIDVSLGAEECRGGYERSMYMGRKIAMSVIANYPLAKKLTGDKVRFGQKNIVVKLNKVEKDSEQIAIAQKVHEVYLEFLAQGTGDWDSYTEFVKNCPMDFMFAERIIRSKRWPDEKELYVTAICVGEVAFAGFPGEPFTEIGTTVKAQSKATLTIPACCANGYEGYFPMLALSEKFTYESNTTQFVMGTAERLIETSVELINSL